MGQDDFVRGPAQTPRSIVVEVDYGAFLGEVEEGLRIYLTDRVVHHPVG